MVSCVVSIKIMRVLNLIPWPNHGKNFSPSTSAYIRGLYQSSACTSLNRSHQGTSLVNKFDLRLRTFLLNVKENFDGTDFHGTANYKWTSKIKIHHIQPLSRLCEKLLQTEAYIYELQTLSIDDDEVGDLAKMVHEEHVQLEETLAQIQNEALEIILQDEESQTEGIIMEFSAGVGGKESMLFCNEILEMYSSYCDSKGWQYELTDVERSDLEGVRRAALTIDHTEAYKKLQFEGGVHRVQRVPKTEKTGRVHTSTVAVAILPRPSEVTVTIEQKDLKIETKKASGAGGQHVNTTESAVRITHLPSGLVAECQTQRSQMQNRKVAIDKIRARLFQMKIDHQLASTRSSRKLQVGSSSRSEKIRTYNFPQDRVTDHRINFTSHNLGELISGARPFEILLCKLKEESQKERVAEFLEQIKL